MPDSPTPITVSTKLSLFSTLGLKSESLYAFFRCPSCQYSFQRRMALHKVFHLSLGLTNWSDESSLTRNITRKLLGCIPVIFKPLQPCSNGTDSTSNAVACLVVQCCSCKLPFRSHHLRVQLFVSRTPRIVVPLSKIEKVCRIPRCSCSQEGLPCLIRVSVLSGSHTSTRFIFEKQR